MTDIYDGKILCNKCNAQTRKNLLMRNGFKIRILECPKCGNILYHPLDLENYKQFNKIKNKRYNVKLRLIGNSFCVSIPKEIVDFRKEMETEMRRMDKIVSLFMQDPEKIVLNFKKKVKNEK